VSGTILDEESWLTKWRSIDTIFGTGEGEYLGFVPDGYEDRLVMRTEICTPDADDTLMTMSTWHPVELE
jgi:hypothetical protein